MESDNLKIIIDELKDGTTCRILAEQEAAKYKDLYEIELLQNEELKNENQRLTKRVLELENKLSFLCGANAIMKLSNLICLNSKKFLANLLNFNLKSENLLTTVAVVEESLYDGTPTECFKEAKILAYQQAKEKQGNTYNIGNGGTYIENESNYTKE